MEAGLVISLGESKSAFLLLNPITFAYYNTNPIFMNEYISPAKDICICPRLHDVNVNDLQW